MGFLKFIALQSLQAFDVLKANLLLISSGNKLEELNFHIYVTAVKHIASLGCLLTNDPRRKFEAFFQYLLGIHQE